MNDKFFPPLIVPRLLRSLFPVICLVSAGIGTTAQAQHANGSNDYLIDALRLDLTGRVLIDTTNFSREPGESGGGTVNSRTAWFAWTAPVDTPAVVRFATYGSSYDTMIGLFKWNPVASPQLPSVVTSLTAVAGAPESPLLVDDDAAITVTQGHITWTPQPGTTYFISVGRNGGGGGGGAMTLEAVLGAVTAPGGAASAVPNDNLANALQFTPIVTSPATQISRGQWIGATTIAATTESGEQTIGAASAPKGGTIWYRYTTGAAPEVFAVEIRDLPSEAINQVVLQAFSNPLAPAVPTFAQLLFAEEDKTSSVLGQPRIVINAAANTEYYLRITSTDGDGALFNVRLDFNPAVPPNDLITNAILLPAVLPVIRDQGEDNFSATQTDPTTFNGNTSGANVWYAWRAPASGLVKIRALTPSANAAIGNLPPAGSAFKFDCEVWFDTSSPRDAAFNTATAQSIASFNETASPQERMFYAIQDVVYFIEIGGDNNLNNAGRGVFAFVIEDARLTTIVRTGVSYGSEGVLKTIGLPAINKRGDIAFPATLELGGPVTAARDQGLFFNNGATTSAIVLKGDAEFAAAPADKLTFAAFTNLFLADRANAGDTSADLGFSAPLASTATNSTLTSANNKGLYHADAAGGDAQEFRLGDYAGRSYTWNDGGGFLATANTPVREPGNNTAIFSGTMAGIPIVRNTAVFSSTRNIVVQEEDPAPNTASGVEFADITGVPTVNGSDYFAFRSILRGTGVTAANDTAIYSVSDFNAAPTALNYRLRLRKGSAASGANGSTLAGGATLFALGEPRMNASGSLVMTAIFTAGTGMPAATSADDKCILSDLVSADESFAMVARKGDLARDSHGQTLPGVRFAAFSAPALITGNAVIFSATVVGTSVTTANNSGLWIWDGAGTYLVARNGDPAQGIAVAGAKYKVLGRPFANSNGRLAFTASLIGAGVTTANDAGLWTVAEDGTTPLLRLRKGEIYNFGRAELSVNRTITSIAVRTGSGGDDGSARGMDQDGNVAVVIGLAKAGLPAGQAMLKVSP